MLDYCWLIPILPLLGFVINGLLGRTLLPRKAVHWIACGSVGISFILAIVLFIQVAGLPVEQRAAQVTIYQWFYAGVLNVGLTFLIDQLSLVMLLTVCGVGFIIHVYSIGYMSHEPSYYRYFAYLNLFMFSMILLVMGGNFLVLFVGWEGVGLCSYLLIGFWYEKKSAADAGKKAFVVNRIGDFGFLLAILLIYTHFGSIDFLAVFEAAPHTLTYGGPVVTAICLLLFLGAMGKSAQIPLYVWLPDAMEGPTPVSALIHAATMVTAGVYMVSRCNILYMMSPFGLEWVAVFGAATAFFAATMGLAQNDIKKVLAYSTISQLGYMFLACGVGAFTAGIFHLMTHAFFKALLFLGSGSVIHGMGGEQDMRKMGALKAEMPVTFLTFIIATVAISGIPPFAGFFSKDEILAKTFFGGHTLLWVIAAITAGMTAFYMFRLVNMTFRGESRVPEKIKHHLHESPKVMLIPLVVLAILSVIGGWIGLPEVLGIVTGIEHINIFEGWLHPVFADGQHIVASIVHHGEGHAHHPPLALEFLLMAVSIGIALIGILVAEVFYIRKPELPDKIVQRFKNAYKVVYNKYYVDEFYDAVFVEGTKKFARGLCRFDLGIIDGIVNGIAYLTRRSATGSMYFDLGVVDGAVNLSAWITGKVGELSRRVQTGHLENYALFMALGAFILIGIIVLL